MCGNRVCNVCAVPVDESQEGYDKQYYQIGRCPNGACEQMKDKIKEKDVVTQSIKQKGNIWKLSHTWYVSILVKNLLHLNQYVTRQLS